MVDRALKVPGFKVQTSFKHDTDGLIPVVENHRLAWRSASRPTDAHVSGSVFSPPPYEGGGWGWLATIGPLFTKTDFASPDRDSAQAGTI